VASRNGPAKRESDIILGESLRASPLIYRGNIRSGYLRAQRLHRRSSREPTLSESLGQRGFAAPRSKVKFSRKSAATVCGAAHGWADVTRHPNRGRRGGGRTGKRQSHLNNLIKRREGIVPANRAKSTRSQTSVFSANDLGTTTEEKRGSKRRATFSSPGLRGRISRQAETFLESPPARAFSYRPPLRHGKPKQHAD